LDLGGDGFARILKPTDGLTVPNNPARLYIHIDQHPGELDNGIRVGIQASGLYIHKQKGDGRGIVRSGIHGMHTAFKASELNGASIVGGHHVSKI